MKQKIIVIIVLLVALIATGALVYAGITIKSKDKKMDEKLVEITFDELVEKTEKKESFILVITQTDCSHCEEYKPVLKEVLYDYDITAYEVNLRNISDEEKSKLKDIANFAGTPATIFIIDGAERQTSDRIVGAAKKDKIIQRFKAMGYIK